MCAMQDYRLDFIEIPDHINNYSEVYLLDSIMGPTMSAFIAFMGMSGSVLYNAIYSHNKIN